MDPNYAPVAYFVLAALAAIIIGRVRALALSLATRFDSDECLPV
jgi:hypothetical protein